MKTKDHSNDDPSYYRNLSRTLNRLAGCRKCSTRKFEVQSISGRRKEEPKEEDRPENTRPQPGVDFVYLDGSWRLN